MVIFRTRIIALILAIFVSACSISTTQPKLEENHLYQNYISQPVRKTTTNKFWKGGGCNQSTEDPSSLNISTTDKDEPIECTSELISIDQGLLDFEVYLKTSDIGFYNNEDITNKLKIQLKFFDENNRELENIISLKNRKVDDSDKLFSLYGINKKEDLPVEDFKKICLVSRFYPYDSGWAPKGAKKASIKITFRGTGNLWFKDFLLRRSKYNDPLIERVKRETDNFNTLDIFPNPRNISEIHRTLHLSKDNVCWDLSDIGTDSKDSILRILNRKESIVNQVNKNCQLNISFKLINSDSVSEEEYKINPEFTRNSTNISITSLSLKGLVYGAHTLSQMITPKKDELEIKLYTISDSPYFKDRAISGRNVQQNDWLEEVKATSWIDESRFNTFYLDPEKEKKGWSSLNNSKFIKILNDISSVNKQKRLFDLGVSLNIYKFSDTENFSFAKKPHLRKLDTLIGKLNILGVKRILIRFDDFAPVKKDSIFSYTLGSKSEIQKFTTIAKAHISLIKYLANKYKNIIFHVVPPWYNNKFCQLGSKYCNEYLETLNRTLNSNINITWTGPEVRSLTIQDNHIKKYKELIPDHDILFWDNSLYARRTDFWESDKEKAKLLSDIEPYSVDWVGDSYKEIRNFYSNSHLSDSYRIQLATTGSFLWNPKEYNPERQLWAYLVYRFGKSEALKILEEDRKKWGEYSKALN